MKKLNLFFLGIFLSGSSLQAQWTQISSPTGSTLYCVFFNDGNTGFVSGSTSGLVYRTTNGGMSWIITNTGSSSTFYDMRFGDFQNGYVVGSLKQVIKTTNAGSSWDIKTSGSGTLYSISFPSTWGYTAGGSPTVIDRSIDGGNNWSALTPPTSNTLRGVFFVNTSVGWFCGYSGAIWKTTDAGTSWIPQNQSSSYAFEKIYFRDLNSGFVIGRGSSGRTIMKSSNGGTNWATVWSTTDGGYLYDFYYASTNIAWAVGSSGRIMKTTDNGDTWYQQTSPSGTATFYGIHMVNANTGYIVGSGGILLKTTNGGGGMETPSFEKITSGQIVTDVNYNNRCAWGDYDDDGFQDMVITSYNDASQSSRYPILMYHNNGDGTFSRVTNNAVVNEPPNRSFGVAWGDYDNDGRLDLFVCIGYWENNMLFHNEGNGVFTKITTGQIVNDGGASQAAAWADYDRDGWLDLFVANGMSNTNENNFLYHNNGNGTFTKITSGSIVNDNTYSRGCAWGDYDNDGWPDLFVVNYQQQNDMLFHNNGNGTFTRILSGPPVNDQLWGSGCTWGDYNNDGLIDLFVTNGGTNRLYQNNGNGNFVLTSLAPSLEGGDSYGSCWTDYNNDGFLDLFVNNSTNNYVYRNDGASFTKVLNEPMAMESGSQSAWGDYNNDGKIDLFSTRNPSNSLFRNITPTGNYLICKLKGGCTSNRSGIGARIRIRDGSYSVIREVSGGFGMGSQNMLWQHFGLGTITNIDSVIVYWPSGNIQVQTSVAANQTILIDECLIGIVNNQILVRYELSQNYPNPFNPKTTIKYALLKPTNVRLTVYSLNGDVVRVLVDENRPAGTHAIEFDGSNIGSGVYLYKIETLEFTDARKMILIK